MKHNVYKENSNNNSNVFSLNNIFPWEFSLPGFIAKEITFITFIFAFISIPTQLLLHVVGFQLNLMEFGAVVERISRRT